MTTGIIAANVDVDAFTTVAKSVSSSACARRTLRLPIARTVPLEDAIPALTELELNHAPRGGKLIVTMHEGRCS